MWWCSWDLWTVYSKCYTKLVYNDPVYRIDRNINTRKHSSRMRTTRLPTVPKSHVWWVGGMYTHPSPGIPPSGMPTPSGITPSGIPIPWYQALLEGTWDQAGTPPERTWDQAYPPPERTWDQACTTLPREQND